MSENASPILWSFDDGRDTTIENPIHIFSDPGNYEVKLYVSDTNNCMDSVSHNITVYYDFILYVPNSFTPNIDGKNDLFLPKGLRMENIKVMNLLYSIDGERKFLKLIIFQKDGMEKMRYQENILG